MAEGIGSKGWILDRLFTVANNIVISNSARTGEVTVTMWRGMKRHTATGDTLDAALVGALGELSAHGLLDPVPDSEDPQ